MELLNRNELVIAGNNFVKEKEYWENKFQSNIVNGHFNLGKLKDTNSSLERINFNYVFNKEISLQLINLCNGSDARLHIILTAYIVTVIKLYSQIEKFVVGTTIDKQPSDKNLINTVLPLIVNIQDDFNFRDLLNHVKEVVFEAIENQNYPVEFLASENEGGKALFDIGVILENMQSKKYIEHINYQVLFAFKTSENKITLNLEYESDVFGKNMIDRVLFDLENIIKQTISDISINLKDINITTKDDILDYTKLNYGSNDKFLENSIIEFFDDFVQNTPESIAIKCKEGDFSYKELHDRSIIVARFLKNVGIDENDIVAVSQERSYDLIAVMLGILRVNASFLPIDPKYPQKRIEFILKDSNAGCFIYEHEEQYDSKWQGKTFKNQEIFTEPLTDDLILDVNYNTNDPAYIIYTSGSTGRPKGVIVEHASLINYCCWGAKEYVRNKKLSFPLYTSISFDLTITSIFIPLITGNSITIFEDENIEDTFEKILKDKDIEIVKLTPAHLQILNNIKTDFKYIKILILGGEALTTILASEAINNFNNGLEVYNEYGPTEATVGCIYYKYTGENIDENYIPIGKPVNSAEVYLTVKNKLVPTHLKGEILIGGNVLSRGYLNNVELSSEKFISENTISEKRLYKSGDLGRLLPNGNMDYQGRNDTQVKIRGYRIEIGEIEFLVKQHEEVEEVITKVIEENNGNKNLCIFYTANKKISKNEIISLLKDEIPEYAIPLYFVQLDEVPLNINGKVALDQLPDPKLLLKNDQAYLPPRDEVDRILVKVWKEVLELDELGIDDNYFSCGGDSIKAIQIVSRLQKYNLQIKHNDLFKYQTIKELGENVKVRKKIASQDIVAGKCALTPIQKWFFDKVKIEKNHFNQSFLFLLEKEIEDFQLENIYKYIIKHHDALRVVIDNKEGEDIQVFKEPNDPVFKIDFYDLGSLESFEQKITEICNNVQKSINLEKGPLIKMCSINTIKGRYIFLTMHHMVIDVVSLRVILLEDLKTLLSQTNNGKELLLPLKTTSYKEWVLALYEYAKGGHLNAERKYWKELSDATIPGLKENTKGEKFLVKDNSHASGRFSKDETKVLTKEITKVFDLDINHLLIAIVSKSINIWKDLTTVLIDVEGHGREYIAEDIDVSRTIGWFTSVYPIKIEVISGAEIKEVITATKSSLNEIPNRGLGYGVLRYLVEDESLVNCENKPEISFNYLGQFKNENDNNLFELVHHISDGESISPDSERLYPLYITGFVTSDQLNISVEYNHMEFEYQDIKDLVRIFSGVVEELIDSYKVNENISDQVNSEELDSILEELN